jgi:hypothetical protein
MLMVVEPHGSVLNFAAPQEEAAAACGTSSVFHYEVKNSVFQ